MEQGLEIKRAESLAQRLLQHPHLQSRIEVLLDVVENADGDVLKADQAEERVIEELRQIGQQALQAWAQRKLSRVTSQSEKREDLSRKEKKTLLAYQIRKDRSRRTNLSLQK